MKAFVTGGTGFIGQRVVRQLIERDYEVACLVRRPAQAAHLSELGATLVQGDINEPDSMRQAMGGADVVFHLAGWYEVGLPPGAAERMERINVGGTKSVLGLAVELGVPKIVYTSTVGVLGDTHGVVVDETYQRDTPFQSAYDRTKYQAHQVAERYIAQGAPIVVVMPTAVYGPGDHSTIADLIRRVLRQRLPVVPGADTGFSFVHVDDVALGHVLAAEKGQMGQSYILGGDLMTIGDVVQAVARLAGVRAPWLFFNAQWGAPLQPLADRLEQFLPLPGLLSAETLRTLGVTWMGTSARAERELGYTHRAFEEGMAETIGWELAQLFPSHQQTTILLALTAVAFIGLALLLRRRRNQA
jgi:dihydroflavonol-4-reductase